MKINDRDNQKAWKKMRSFPVIAMMLIMACSVLPGIGLADIKYIDLTNPFLRKIPVAVPVFSAIPSGKTDDKLTAGIADKLSDMLEYTGYFTMLDREAFLYDPKKGDITITAINFQNWTTVGAELLITGGVQLTSDELVLELRLFDTFKAALVVGRRYRGRIEDQRDMIRRFCSEVIKALTGSKGLFYSQIAFVSNGTGHKEIYTCEFDGSDAKLVTQKRTITSFPSWSEDGRYIAFTSFENGPSQIFVRDLKSGLEKAFQFKSAQIAPAWIPHRFELSTTLSIDGDQEIYLLTGGGKMIKRMTYSPGIDVDATWSPDGKKMAFVSKRAGTPQIYVQEMGNNRIQRLTFKGRYNTQPSWSPKGDKIAYSSMEEGQLNIYVIDVEGNHPIRLTHNQGDNEAPSWSPDGNLIAFRSTREGVSRIYVMTAYGTDQRRLLALTGEQSHPEWSPNMLP